MIIVPNNFEDGAASLRFLQFLDYVTSKLFELHTDTFDRFYQESVLKIYLIEHFISLARTHKCMYGSCFCLCKDTLKTFDDFKNKQLKCMK